MLNISNHDRNANSKTMRYYFTPVRMVIIKNTNDKCWQSCREKEILIYCW